MNTLIRNETNNVLSDVTTKDVSLIWVKLPSNFQNQVMSHLLSMCDPINDYQSVLLGQGTGGRKLLVYQCTGTIVRVFILVIEITLSLSSDQWSKMSKVSKEFSPPHRI